MNSYQNDTGESETVEGLCCDSPAASEDSSSVISPGTSVTGADCAGVSDHIATNSRAARPTVAQALYEQELLLKFQTPCSICLIGMNNCGKTTCIPKMLEQADGVFTEPPKRVIVCNNIFQNLFRRMAETVPNISFYQRLPDRTIIENWALETGGHLMLVFDELIQSKAVNDLTIMLSHHLNISCIMTSHKIFMSAKFSKTISTNLHYILLFTLRNRLQLSILGSQLFCHKGKARNFVKVYDLVTSVNGIGNPLIIDNSPRCTNRQYMLCSRVMSGEFPIVYEID